MNALQDTKKEIQSDIWHVIEKNAFKKFLFYNIASYQNSNTISLEKFVRSFLLAILKTLRFSL